MVAGDHPRIVEDYSNDSMLLAMDSSSMLRFSGLLVSAIERGFAAIVLRGLKLPDLALCESVYTALEQGNLHLHCVHLQYRLMSPDQSPQSPEADQQYAGSTASLETRQRMDEDDASQQGPYLQNGREIT